MSQVLRAHQEDVPLLSAYLHDSKFDIRDLRFDPKAGVLSLPLDRVCYESARPGRFLLVIPVLRYPVVRSELRISNVVSYRLEWRDERDRGLWKVHELLEITVTERVATIETEWAYLRLFLNRFEELALADLAEPAARPSVMDFSRSVFASLTEIERLRRGAA